LIEIATTTSQQGEQEQQAPTAMSKARLTVRAAKFTVQGHVDESKPAIS